MVVDVLHGGNVAGDIQLIILAVMSKKPNIQSLNNHPLEVEPAKTQGQDDIRCRAINVILKRYGDLLKRKLVVFITVLTLKKAQHNIRGSERNRHRNSFFQKGKEPFNIAALPSRIIHVGTELRDDLVFIFGQFLIPTSHTELIFRNHVRGIGELPNRVLRRLRLGVATEQRSNIGAGKSRFKSKLLLRLRTHRSADELCHVLSIETGTVNLFVISLGCRSIPAGDERVADIVQRVQDMSISRFCRRREAAIAFESLYILPQHPALIDINDVGRFKSNQTSNTLTEVLDFSRQMADVIKLSRSGFFKNIRTKFDESQGGNFHTLVFCHLQSCFRAVIHLIVVDDDIVKRRKFARQRNDFALTVFLGVSISQKRQKLLQVLFLDAESFGNLRDLCGQDNGCCKFYINHGFVLQMSKVV